MLTTQKQVRQAFWDAWRDGEFKGMNVTPKRITDYSGTGKMHNTDTRTAFCDYVDYAFQKWRACGRISRPRYPVVCSGLVFRS